MVRLSPIDAATVILFADVMFPVFESMNAVMLSSIAWSSSTLGRMSLFRIESYTPLRIERILAPSSSRSIIGIPPQRMYW